MKRLENVDPTFTEQTLTCGSRRWGQTQFLEQRRVVFLEMSDHLLAGFVPFLYNRFDEVTGLVPRGGVHLEYRLFLLVIQDSVIVEVEQELIDHHQTHIFYEPPLHLGQSLF